MAIRIVTSVPPRVKDAIVARALSKVQTGERPQTRTLAQRIAAHYRETASGPYENMRPASNLYPHPEFMHKEGKKSLALLGSLFFYNNGVKNSKVSWASLAVAIMVPTMQQAKLTAKDLKPYRTVFAGMSEAWTAKGLSAAVSLKKGDTSTSVSVPFFSASVEQIRALRDCFHGSAVPPDQEAQYALRDFNDVQGTPVGFNLVEDVSPLFAPYLKRLKAIKGASFHVKTIGTSLTFFINLRFTAMECEFLCQTKWLEIRPIDIYGLMRTWSDSRLGQNKVVKVPQYSLSLQQINASLPGKGTPRVHPELELLVDQDSEYWYIPADYNHIGQYDSQLAQGLTRPDGTLSAMPSDEDDKVQLPPSQLVYVDWVNLKVAYSNTEGRLQVMSLDRAKEVTDTHIRRFLDLALFKDIGKSFWTRVWNTAEGLGGPASTSTKIETVLEEISDISDNSLLPQDVTIKDLRFYAGRHDELGQFKTAVDIILQYAASSIENLFSRYSVVTVLQLVAWCRMYKEADRYQSIKLSDEQSRQSYQNQEVDPNHENESVPYWREEDRFMLPHQGRVANRLRSGANFAILPVHAGGGKTSIAIYDILKEMKQGTVKRALILCPSHLVGQYVKEFVDFCAGRVNVIAVSAYTMKRHKLSGLAKIIQSAPINSVVVADYNMSKGKTRKVAMGYGPAPSHTFPVVEMLRRFGFDYVVCDEAHYLKNASSRQSAIARLIADIPKKRLMSGTITPDSINDLVKQVEMLDPTIFGGLSNFFNDYALKMRGSKVSEWQPGADRAIMARLKESVVWAPAKRKEWAALLPPLVEESTLVSLSEKQQACYKAILTQVLDEIKVAMMGNKALAKLLGGAQTTAPGEDDEDEDDDDDLDIDKLLRPYLQRLEIFVAAPGSDELGSRTLTGEDLISPKVRHIAQICDEHLGQGLPGKILIFTSYKESAQAIYDNLPSHLQAQTLHYLAANKAECAAQFENDPNTMIMVGVETSMNTGLNLQFASRLIRADSVWTPGALEQGNSRVQRPNLKTAENRSAVYINWVTCDKTIDVTKQAYLLAKRVTIGKFEEAGNPLYEDVEPPPLFKMSLETIEDADAASGDLLAPYFNAYEGFVKAQRRDFKLYREQHPEDIGPDGTVRKDPIARGPNLPESKLMYRVPYVPGTELYKADDLGLIRYDKYMLLSEQDLDEDDEEDGEGSAPTSQATANAEEQAKVEGLGVHTEYGDGLVHRVYKKHIVVEMPDGTRINVPKLSAFIITRAQTNSADMRSLLLQQNGDIPFDRPIDIQVKEPRKVDIPKGKKGQEPVDTRIAVAFSITVINDFVGLEFNDADTNPAAARILESIGFKQPAPYFFTEVKDHVMMFRLFNAWKKADVKIHQEYNDACKSLYVSLGKMRKNAANLVGVATEADLRNFFRLQQKPVANPNMVCPYPLVQDNRLYIALPASGHPGSMTGMRVKVPGIKWYKAETEKQLANYMPSLQTFNKRMQAIIGKNVFVITNIKDLVSAAKKLHRKSPSLIPGTRPE